MNLLSLAYKISRPRFWVYLGGTYLVGYAFGAGTLTDFHYPLFLINLIFFLFIANIFLYAINDYFDWDTDQYNVKKGTKEYRMKEKEKKIILSLVLISLTIGLIIASIQKNTTLTLLFLVFLGLSAGYSMKPLRFKARPFFDFLSNSLYIIPGLIGYYQIQGHFPNIYFVTSFFFWAFSMHLFSALPDIAPDKKAKVITSAVYLGYRPALALTTCLWLIFSIGLYLAKTNVFLASLSLIYPILSFSLFFFKENYAEKYYWYYPYLNAAFGFFLFLYAILNLGQ